MQLRKIIHIGGVLIPVIAFIIGKNQTIALVLSGFAAYLIIEVLKQKISPHILSMVYRENELKSFSIEPLSYFISVPSLLYISSFIAKRYASLQLQLLLRVMVCRRHWQKIRGHRF